ncbi:hypothetical protein FRB94_014352 [Tulasnella sp. JGI-2019a]|nr:hypothetical protein FRB93_008620 [Tulasnella sp. JGI-2019a]KAG9007497.1 hypothetical protein FRB94_014352 [Tulasnella sp. JGI-2019a]KAG9036415.1 hypothetical protein FRB95_008956 [Tulasnella sp. JGI-2019a]
MYNGPLGLPFVLEDKTGSLTNTTLTDIYGRLTIRFDESLVRPGRAVTMVRVVSAETDQAPLVPEAVLDFDLSNQSTALGSVMYPPRQSIPMDAYMQKMPPQQTGGLLCRKFTASDGQEYKWTLIHQSQSRAQWTCVTSTTNYFVASYDVVDDHMTGRPGAGSKSFSVTDTWVHLAVELLTSLAILRHISYKELK